MPTPSADLLTIHTIRETKVILDSDLARLYGVTTKRLLEQVRRNQYRFPHDFCFQLDRQDVADLRSQIATLSGTVCSVEFRIAIPGRIPSNEISLCPLLWNFHPSIPFAVPRPCSMATSRNSVKPSLYE